MSFLLKRLSAALLIALSIGSAQADNFVDGLATNTTIPLPTQSCFYVDQFNGTSYSDTKLCSGWAKAIGALSATNNLSDLTNLGTARANLGLGTAAISSTGTSGATIPLLNGANAWSGVQSFNSGVFLLNGATSGSTTVNAAAAASGTLTLPAATDTLTANATAATLTNKTINCANNACTVRLANDVSGNLPVTNLNGGNSASAATFWRGDGTWATPAGSGNLTGPSSAVSGDVATFSGTSGSVIQDSGTQLTAFARLASPSFTGTPTAPTAATGTNTAQIATTAFVQNQAYATLASPAFSGTPTAPTPTQGTNSTQIATTAFVKSQQIPISIGWIAGQNPNNAIATVINQPMTVNAIVAAVEVANGSTATVTVNHARSGVACSAGTALHSGSFNANGAAATDQTMTVTTTSLAVGDRICLQTTGGTNWNSGSAVGTITIFASPS